jgi:molybdopterin molybdotransferase
MMTVEEARDAILARFAPLPAETIAITDALGRVLAEDATAAEDLPPFANSAMDGYALIAADAPDASAAQPRRLALVGEVPAGSVYSGTLQPGAAIRILTGAPVPAGADAVIQQELTQAGEGWVEVQAAVKPGNNIRDAGSDVRRDTLLARHGTEIGPAEIALLAALGITPVRVARRPRVAILATGDELAAPGAQPGPGQIRDSNTPYLAAAVARAGAEPWVLGIARDNADELRACLARAAEADLALTTGGVSVGTYDLVKQVLAEQGTMAFWRVRMRPGKPLAFGALGQTPLLGLPGNPVSTAVTFELFGRPAIRRMLGCAQIERPVVEVELAGEPVERGDRRHYVRVRLESRAGRLVATPTGPQGSHVITSLLGASALLVVDEGEGHLAPGDHARALLLADMLPWG